MTNETTVVEKVTGAVCAQSTNADAAKAFLDWCLSDKDAQEIWQKWGFELA